MFRFIRSREVTKHTPVVVLTSSSQHQDVQRSYNLGANSYLIKPIGRDALIEMVESLNAYWIKLNQVPIP